MPHKRRIHFPDTVYHVILLFDAITQLLPQENTLQIDDGITNMQACIATDFFQHV